MCHSKRSTVPSAGAKQQRPIHGRTRLSWRCCFDLKSFLITLIICPYIIACVIKACQLCPRSRFFPGFHHIYETTSRDSHEEKLLWKTSKEMCQPSHCTFTNVNSLCTGFKSPVQPSACWVALDSTRYSVTHFADLAMVSVLGLLLKTFPLLQHLWVWEGNPIDPLQSLHVGAALPVSWRVLMTEAEKTRVKY